MSQAPTPYIDYESCYWDYAGDGENIECNDGYVGIGACGSLTGDTCNNNAEGIQCCLMKREYFENTKWKGHGTLLKAGHLCSSSVIVRNK